MLYFHTKDYNQVSEDGLNVLDPLISINWPEKITECSKRDSSFIMLNDSFKGIDL